MPFPLNPEQATLVVLWGGLALGIALGGIAQVSRFCTMGALADWFTYGGTDRLMLWAIAVLVAAVGSLALVDGGLLDANQTLAWSNKFLWLSNLVGGAIFGVGMVLASGCPQRNLIKLGSGSLKALVVLLVAAVVAQMSLRGMLAPVRVELLDSAGLTLAHSQDLGSLLAKPLGMDATALRWWVIAVVFAATARWWWRPARQLEKSQWFAGGAIGILVVLAWALTGYAGYVPEHPDTLEAMWLGTYSHRPEAFTFAAPLAHSLDLLTLWSDRNTVLSYGVVVSLGTVLGSAALALLRKEIRIESFRGTTDLVNHLLGGALMGFGAVTAMGCSIGQGLSGLSLQSAGAVVMVVGMTTGTWLALKWQAWQLERAESLA
jgi:uncharacterized membrane protein YedE/YeeE